MKKSSKGNIAVKDQDVFKSQRSHVGELRQVCKTLRLGFGIKGRVRHVAFFQNDESDLLQQRGVKEGCHRSAVVLAERPSVWPEEFPLPVQVVSNLADRLSNSRFIPGMRAGRGHRIGIGYLPGYAAVVMVQGVCGRQRFAQDVSLRMPGKVL